MKRIKFETRCHLQSYLPLVRPLRYAVSCASCVSIRCFSCFSCFATQSPRNVAAFRLFGQSIRILERDLCAALSVCACPCVPVRVCLCVCQCEMTLMRGAAPSLPVNVFQIQFYMPHATTSRNEVLQSTPPSPHALSL